MLTKHCGINLIPGCAAAYEQMAGKPTSFDRRFWFRTAAEMK
jgi:hypothetical protein